MVTIFLVGCTLSAPTDSAESVPVVSGKTKIMIGSQIFYIDLADEKTEREQGLMYVESMPANQGMLFVFEGTAPRNFWMKNTLIPLDMVWLDAEKTIVDIQAAQPCKVERCPVYSGKVPAQYVLELNQGVLRARVGDRVEF